MKSTAKKPVVKQEPEAPKKPTFGENIARLLEAKKWNQSDLARATGLGRDSVSNYIKGRHFPEPANLKKIAEALRTTPQELCPEGTLGDSYEANQFSFHQIASDPLKVAVRIDRTMSFESFMKIAQIIKEEDEKTKS